MSSIFLHSFSVKVGLDTTEGIMLLFSTNPYLFCIQFFFLCHKKKKKSCRIQDFVFVHGCSSQEHKGESLQYWYIVLKAEMYRLLKRVQSLIWESKNNRNLKQLMNKRR